MHHEVTREGNDSCPLEPMAKAAQAAQEHLEVVADSAIPAASSSWPARRPVSRRMSPLKQAIDVPGARRLVALLA